MLGVGSKWSCLLRVVVYEEDDRFCGKIEKEVFLFEFKGTQSD